MITPTSLPGGVVLRPLEIEDAPALLASYRRSREHLRPWEPIRPESFWTLDGQRARVEAMVQMQKDGRELSCGLFRDDRLVGCATLGSVVLGAWQNAHLGYWIDVTEIGKGLATAAVTALCRIGEQDLGLHRIQASTNPDNTASQRVLAKNGFVHYGSAPDYLYINGRWTDSHLFQRILHDREPGDPNDYQAWREVNS